MKKILITGAGSYIGVSFETYIKQHFPDLYRVDTVDMIDGTWREKSFSGYDAVYHVAGIAHSDSEHISEEQKAQYRAVNTDLAIETAEKAKAEGVRQFVFMSSSVVYGGAAPIGQDKIITKETPVCPANCYGDSKARAEQGLIPLSDEQFKVVILRSPMVYGKGSKGNFSALERLAVKCPMFPRVTNQRSMLYIGNLVEFVRLMIEHEESGIFWPQNAEYSNTGEIVRMIRQENGKKARLIGGCTWALKMLGHVSSKVNKAFGNFCYDQRMSSYPHEYRRYSLKDSITETEKGHV